MSLESHAICESIPPVVQPPHHPLKYDPSSVEDKLLHLFHLFHKAENFDDFADIMNISLNEIGCILNLKQIIFCRFNPVFNEVRHYLVWPQTPDNFEHHHLLNCFENFIYEQRMSRPVMHLFNALLEDCAYSGTNPSSLFPLDLNHGHGGFLYIEFDPEEEEIAYKHSTLKLYAEFITMVITKLEEILELEWSKDMYQNLLVHSMTAVLIVDLSECKVIASNDRFTELTKYPAHEADSFIKEVKIQFNHQESTELNVEVFSNRRVTVHSKDQRILHIVISLSPISDSPYHTLTFVDVSDRVAIENKLNETLDQMKIVFEHTLDAIAHLTDYVDPYTSTHQYRTAALAVLIAKGLDLNEENIENLEIASKIHDIGKILLPPEIINKPGKYTEIEAIMVQTHVAFGYELIKRIDFHAPIADIIHQHHERLDGSGYPKGLKSDELLLESKILAVANLADQLLSHRPFRPAHDLDSVIGLLRKDSIEGRLYPPAVQQCIELLQTEQWKP